MGAISIPIGDTPPEEFRIFRAGLNRTQKGDFYFTKRSEHAVMASYLSHALDAETPGMIDLEHLSLDVDAPNFDPDARGWYRLEVRNHELWATKVAWTPDGTTRLTNKTQRFVSPFFKHDTKTKEVLEIRNIAITAMPATDQTQALVAASARLAMADAPATPETPDPTGADTMDVDALLSGLGMDADSLVKGLGLTGDASLQDIAAAMDAALDKIGPLAGITDDDDPGMTPATTVDANGKEVGPGGVKASGAGAGEYKAMRSTLLRETNKPTVLEALSEMATWKASHIKLELREKQIDADRSKLERAERFTLAARLVKTGHETPHTSGLAYKKLSKHLAEMPIQEFRDRVTGFEKLGGVGHAKLRTGAPATGSETSVDVAALTARELEHCEEMGVKPETYAQNKVRREASRAASRGDAN